MQWNNTAQTVVVKPDEEIYSSEHESGLKPENDKAKPEITVYDNKPMDYSVEENALSR